jgi:hypothetical protein
MTADSLGQFRGQPQYLSSGGGPSEAPQEWFGLVTRARRPVDALVDHRDGEASRP